MTPNVLALFSPGTETSGRAPASDPHMQVRSIAFATVRTLTLVILAFLLILVLLPAIVAAQAASIV